VRHALKGDKTESSATEERRVYVFKKGSSAGRKEMKALLGGKGANLCEMAHLGLNVPPGFTITTKVCQAFYEAGGKLPAGVWEDVLAAVKEVEEVRGQRSAAAFVRGAGCLGLVHGMTWQRSGRHDMPWSYSM
jgi:pyruvate,orthophosphate dikinase